MNRITSVVATLLIATPTFALESGTIGTYTLSPEPGEVETLSSIKIDFPDTGAFGIEFPSKETMNPIKLTSDSKNYYVVKWDYTGSSHVTLHFAEEGSETEVENIPSGTYTLIIPEKTFFEFYSQTKYNAPITAKYVVKTSGAGDSETLLPFGNAEVSPLPSIAVGRLDKVSITFPNLTNGLEFPIADLTKITLQIEGEEQKYISNSPTVSGSAYQTVSFGFNKPDVSVSEMMVFTEKGNYVLSIAEGAFSEYLHSENRSPAMTYTFTVDPSLNFSYMIEPTPDAVYESLTSFTLQPGSTMTDLRIANPELKASLSLDENMFILTASETENGVVLDVPANKTLAPGDWTLNIPAGMLTGTSAANGNPMPNHDAISAIYKVREPMHFDYTITPADGSTVDMISSINVAFSGSDLKQVNVDTEAKSPTISGGSLKTPLNLSATLSGKSVELKFTAALEDGTYTISVPDGFIYTIDSNKLRHNVEAFTLSYTVSNPEKPDFHSGIIIANEGWFGHDRGSFNFIPYNGVPYYNAFLLNNPDKNLGTTTQSAQIFGSHLFAVSKQTPFLTGIDATTFGFENELTALDGSNTQAHAFCAINEEKGYLSTSNGLYVVNLSDYTISKQITGSGIVSKKFGQILRYGNHAFVVSQLDGVLAINIDTDEPTIVDIPTAAALTVTASGKLYAITLNESNEFVEIDPLTFETNNIDIDGDATKIQNPWSTWREASVASDKNNEVIYFVPSGWTPKTVNKYNLTTGEYTPAFITLPGKADGLENDQILYGQGLTVDPTTGYIVLTATEAGYGIHYEQNWVYFCDPATGEILNDKTVKLRDYYWFPAMALYPDFSAPELTLTDIEIEDAGKTADFFLPDLTEVTNGNKHLIIYEVASTNEDVFTCRLATDGKLTLSGTGTGYAELEVKASYQGRETTKKVEVTCNPIEAGINGASAVDATADVYTLSGILILRAATRTEIEQLPAGMYIIGSKKVVIRK